MSTEQMSRDLTHDQTIIIDCITYNVNIFQLIKHTNPNLDPWFVFQTFLL